MKTEILFKKLLDWRDKEESNDLHNVIFMFVDNAIMGNILSYRSYTEILETYFEYSPEVFEIVSNEKYPPHKLLKLFQRIVWWHNFQKKNEYKDLPLFK